MFKFSINLLILWLFFELIFHALTNEVFEFDHTIYYKIPSYYGSRAAGFFFIFILDYCFLEYFSKNAILKGNASVVKWPIITDEDKEFNYYFKFIPIEIILESLTKKIMSSKKLIMIII